MSICNLEKFVRKSLIIALMIFMALCFCTHFSYAEEATDDNFGKFTYDKETARLLKDMYETEPIVFAKSHSALKPISTIKRPRYRYRSDGIYKSSTVKKDGIATIMLTGDVMCQKQRGQSDR